MNKIMVLATFHMESQNDVRNDENIDDFNSDELTSIINHITAFNPTIVAVECDKKYQNWLDEEFRQYLSSNSCKSNNEIYQIGFRVAQKVELKRVHAVDWMEMGVAQNSCGDVLDFIEKNEPELFSFMKGFETDVVNLQKENLLDAFIRLNSKEEADNSKAYYVNIARSGNNNFHGNSWLLWWFQRNLNIFSNIANLVDHKTTDQRILLLIGAAHKGILEEFISDSRCMEIVDAIEYLK